MADEDISAVQASLAEIKLLLTNKKKEKGEAVTADLFTDPRFFEIFENYFKPLVESSKTIRDRVTEKKKISIFDVIGLSDRLQETKRTALTKEIDKLTEKIRNIGKNLGNANQYSISSVLGISKGEKATNRRMVNEAIRELSLSIRKSAKNLGNSQTVMKFIGLRPIKMPTKFELAKIEPPKVEPPVVIAQKPKKGKKAQQNQSTVATSTPPPVVTPKPPSTAPQATAPVVPTAPTLAPTPSVPNAAAPTLAEKETASRNVIPVAIVEVGDTVKNWFEKVTKGMGGGSNDKGLGTGTDRESYSHSMNAVARLLTLGAALLAAGIPALISGLFDQGPLKGIKKMVASYSLSLAAKLGKTAMHYISGFASKAFAVIGKFFEGSAIAKVAGEGIKVFKGSLIGKMGGKLLGFLGKALKKLPGIGALISLGFAINRFANGDIQGGLIDLASGAASTIPIIGTAVSIGLDIINAQADLASGGVTANKKGWLGKFNTFIGRMFSKLIYSNLATLPFGLGSKVAGWMGLDMNGLAEAAAEDPTADKAVNPTVDHARSKLKTADAVRKKAETRKKDILAGRDVNQLSESERAEYEKQDATIERAEKSLEEQRNVVRNANIKKPDESKDKLKDETPKTPDAQKPVLSDEEKESAAAQKALDDDTPVAEQRVDRPPTPTEKPVATKADETVTTLKSINSNLETMNAKTTGSADVPASFVNVSNNVQNSSGGKSGSTPLQYVIETSRDTAHFSRERTRNMILDYRAIA